MTIYWISLVKTSLPAIFKEFLLFLFQVQIMNQCLKLCGVVITLCIIVACSANQESAVTATVKEVPQRPMTLTNGYHPGLFPFNKGEPFVMDPNMGAIDFNTKPPNQRSDEYYDYDSKLEEVPYDYKGDPIDRKDVVEPNLPRPNDIKPSNNDNKQTDIYKFLNLPIKYTSSDKFPLMSSSYANTKVQGSGLSSSLSNHKMPQTLSTSTNAPTISWYNTVKTTVKPITTTLRPTTTSTTTTTARTTTTTTTTAAPSQEYEEESMYDYDYYHPQEPVSSSTIVTTSTATNPPMTTTTIHYNNPSPSSSSTIITPESTTTMSTTTPVTTTKASTTTEKLYSPTFLVLNKTVSTTPRPEIDSKLDGTSFADYDTIKSTEKEHQEYTQHFKPLPGNYQFDDKTYPLITNSKVPMTFTAHVSSGISLNQKEHSPDPKPSPAVSEPTYSVPRPLQPEIQDSKAQETVYDNSRLTSSSKPETSIKPSESPSTYYSKPKPSKPNGNDHLETVYFKVRPDTYTQQVQFPSTVSNRPANSPIQSRPYQPEQPVIKTSQSDIIRKPVNTELQISQGRPQPYPVQPDVYIKNKPQHTLSQSQPQYTPSQNQPQFNPSKSQPQYTPSQSQPQYTAPQIQPDTSKFKPPKHVINHFIKTQPNEDNKSYALQTSFSIGMDGERTETRPQGIGQVLLVEDGSSETNVNQTTTVKSKPTTSIPLIPPSRPIQKPLPYPRPQWENIPKPPTYYPPPKREGIPPPQRPNLPNILPQFRPNAKVDTPIAPQSHSATIERVQIPMDHLRPPPLPKPQFLKLDRNDDNIDEEILDIPEKETRILQRTGPQPAKVTTLQMIQHGAPVKIREDNKENPVHIIYAANSPPKPTEKIIDDSVLLDVKDRSDVPILKTKTTINKPIKTDFPYQIIKPDENQNVLNTSFLEYKAYSPTKPDIIKPNDQELVPNLQDYVPVAPRDPAPHVVMSQKPISATLKTSEDNHKIIDEGHKPQLQNFQIPFQPSLKLPENSNGWSVVRKSQSDNASERVDESGDVVASTEKFDPDNFKPQLVGGFMPINPPSEESKEKKAVEQSERAK